MSVAKTIEVIASSSSGIEDAVRKGIAKVGETVKNMEGVWVKDTKAVVKGDSIAEWRVTIVITFIVD